MSSRVIEYVIAARDKTAAAVRSATAAVKDFGASVARNLMNVKAGFDMLSGVARSFAGAFQKAIGEAFKMEKAVADFRVLLKSADAAKEHIAELKQFASSTPLTFDDLARASKLLLSFGADAESIMPTLKTLGDVSMGDAQKFQGLALVFAQVQSAGKLMGQDLLQMINQGFNPLTVIAQQTGRSMSELKDMMADGAISFEMVAEAFRVATSEGGLFAGAMDEAAKTGSGLVSTLQDNWTDAVRQFGEAFSDGAKGGIQELINKLQELVADGSIKKWAEEATSALTGVFSLAGKIADLWRGSLGTVFAFARGADKAFNEGNWYDLAGQWNAGKEAAMEYYNAAFASSSTPASSVLKRKPTLARATTAAATPAAVSSAPARSLSTMLAEADAAKSSAAEDKALEKAEAQAAEAAERLAEEEERRRLALEQKIQRQRLEYLREEMDERVAEATDAEAELAAARQRAATAWGWYRDKDSLRAQIAEEKADAAAEKTFAVEFDRLKRRRADWRTADNLSLDDEAVRRVGLAREQEAEAEKYAAETAEAATRAADALEVVRRAFEESEVE